MTLGKGMNTLTSELVRDSAVGQPGWGPRNPSRRWFETRGDTTECRIRDLSSTWFLNLLFCRQSFCLRRRCCEIANKTGARWCENNDCINRTVVLFGMWFPPWEYRMSLY